MKRATRFTKNEALTNLLATYGVELTNYRQREMVLDLLKEIKALRARLDELEKMRTNAWLKALLEAERGR